MYNDIYYLSRYFLLTKMIELKTTENIRLLFLGAISLGRVVIRSLKMVINILRTCEVLYCEWEPYRFSGWIDPSVHTDSCFFYIKVEKGCGWIRPPYVFSKKSKTKWGWSRPPTIFFKRKKGLIFSRGNSFSVGGG